MGTAFSAQTVDGSGDIVGGQEVHQHIHSRLGVVLQQGENPVFQFPWAAPCCIVQYGGTEGVVHHPVQLISQQIAPLSAVAFLCGGVLPDLPDDQLVRVCSFDAPAQVFNELVRQLVCHIQPEARRPLIQPVPEHALIPADELRIGGLVFLYIGQGVDAPPGLIFLRVADEAVPGEVGAVLGLAGAAAVIAVEFVEVYAVRPGVGEYPVQQNPDAPGFRIPAQGCKILVGAQQRIHLPVVGGVVPVIFVGFKDGVQIQAGDAQLLEIGELPADALQIAAEIVVVPYMTVLVRLVAGGAAPVLPEHPVLRDVFMGHAAFAEPVREDLVHDAALEPAGGFKVPAEHRKLEQLSLVQHALAGAGALDINPLSLGNIGKIVVVYPRILCGKHGGVGGHIPLPGDGVQGDEPLLEAAAEQHHHRSALQLHIPGQPDGKGALLPLADGAEGAFVSRIPAVV